MALTYQDFKQHLQSFLWRAGDAVLQDNLDNLIRMANSKLRVDLHSNEREASSVISVGTQDTAFPDDYHSIRAVTDLDELLPTYKYVVPSELRARRIATNSKRWYPIYSTENKTLLLVGPTQDANPNNPLRNFHVDYIRDIPDFALTDTSWVADTYLDIYTYATLMHASSFLREDERVALWSSNYMSGITSVNEEAEFRQIRGVPAAQQLNRSAGVRHRR